MSRRDVSLCIVLIGALFACGEEPTPTPSAGAETTFDFEDGMQGWKTGFADLPADHDPSIYELESGHGPMPSGLGGNGIRIRGHNRSDDLFMYLTRRVEGLAPGQYYDVDCTVEFATNARAGSVGVGFWERGAEAATASFLRSCWLRLRSSIRQALSVTTFSQWPKNASTSVSVRAVRMVVTLTNPVLVHGNGSFSVFGSSGSSPSTTTNSVVGHAT